MIGKRNLAPERGPNVWARHDWNAAAAKNRWLTGIGGAAIAAAGAALAAVGGSMIYRATRTPAPGGVEPANLDALPLQANRLEDVVARESAQSFPASDAPSWTTTGATGVRE